MPVSAYSATLSPSRWLHPPTQGREGGCRNRRHKVYRGIYITITHAHILHVHVYTQYMNVCIIHVHVHVPFDMLPVA